MEEIQSYIMWSARPGYCPRPLESVKSQNHNWLFVPVDHMTVAVWVSSLIRLTGGNDRSAGSQWLL